MKKKCRVISEQWKKGAWASRPHEKRQCRLIAEGVGGDWFAIRLRALRRDKMTQREPREPWFGQAFFNLDRIQDGFRRQSKTARTITVPPSTV